jgi:hypothetical protein
MATLTALNRRKPEGGISIFHMSQKGGTAILNLTLTKVAEKQRTHSRHILISTYIVAMRYVNTLFCAHHD